MTAAPGAEAGTQRVVIAEHPTGDKQVLGPYTKVTVEQHMLTVIMEPAQCDGCEWQSNTA